MRLKAFLAVLFLLVALPFLLSAQKSIVPPYQIFKAGNGVPVYFFASENVPLFEVRLVYDNGTDWDPDGKSGLAMFAAAMTRRGLPGLDENAIARKLDDVAGGVDVSVGDELATVSSFGLNEHVDEITDLMFKSLTNPTFPEGPFKRLKTNHLDSIKQMPDNPAGLAGHVLDVVLYNGSTKARPGTGLRREVERINLGDARKYYPKIFRTDRLRVLVIGGKEHREILSKVLEAVGKLPCPECGKPVPQPHPWEYPTWRVPPGRILLVDRPGITEAHVRMGFLGPKRKTPEFYDLRVAETILSGHYASRLNMVIREKMNLTYNISAAYYFGYLSGNFSLATSTQNDKIGELLTQTNRLLSGFVVGDVSDDEIKMAKDYILGSYPLGLQNLYVTANTFFNGVLTELEPDFMDVFSDRIAAVTRASLKAAVAKHFHFDQMVTVVVGDARILGPKLKKAGFDYVVRSPRNYL